MKPNLLTCFILALLALTSCESMFDKAFDKEADYKYKIDNNTPDTVQMLVQANSNPGSVVVASYTSTQSDFKRKQLLGSCFRRRPVQAGYTSRSDFK